ncbi:MAG: DUF2933 domain-containing protein [Chloroflexia bacterium]
MNKMLKMCLNWKVLTAIAAGVLLLTVAVPGFSAVLPVLLFLTVCPLMMFLMMNGMMGEKQSGSSHGSPQSEHTANVNPNATPTELVAELRAEQVQISRRIAELEASSSHVTLEAPGHRGV